MIEIVQEERKKQNSPLLKNLDLNVGIHTGRILGGIIGSKIVRYDIFGQDVLIAKLIEHHGSAGFVTVSEQFHNLLKKKPFVYDTFDWSELKKIKVDNSDKRVMLFRVEKIFAMDGSSSEELLEPGHDHVGDHMGKDMKLSGRGHNAEEGHHDSHKPHVGQHEWEDDAFIYQ